MKKVCAFIILGCVCCLFSACGGNVKGVSENKEVVKPTAEGQDTVSQDSAKNIEE